MKEINRQFVVFGNFNSLSFDDVLTLTELKQEYNFKFSSIPDITQNQSGAVVGPQKIQSRPVFVSENQTINVFFGTSRIHIEQLNDNSDTYNEFNKMSIDIINNIVNTLNLNFNRIAINGRFKINDNDKIETIFNKIFKDSKLYNSASKEWQIRLLSNEKNEALQCLINKIATFQRANFTNDGKTWEDSLICGYDISTQVNNDKLFDLNSINEFNIIAQNYRNEFLNMV